MNEEIERLQKRINELHNQCVILENTNDVLSKAYDKLKYEIDCYNKGMDRCGLCGCWDYGVNHHRDCSICAKDQYGD